MKRTLIVYLILTSIAVNLHAQRYIVKELRSISNPLEWELAPVLYDSGLVYMSNRKIPSTKQYVSDFGTPLTNIYFAAFDENDKFGKPKKFSERLSTNADDGPVTFAQNGQMLCICIQNGHAGQNLPKNGMSGLYFSYKNDDQWGALEPFEHNDATINFSTPFLSADGKTLYFAADSMEDSFGGWDIYVSRLEGRRWTTPENLGGNINTAEWDFFPFLHPSGRLFFSSRGHSARGGSFDLFSSSYYKGEWSKPVPVPTLNTNSDEIAMIINEDFSEGYFTRKAGNDFNILKFEYPNYEAFTQPRAIQRNRFCFRLRENSLDTIDYSIFSYEWVINDTLSVEGHDVKFCFPGPGDYYISFNVTNKLTDSVMYDVANLYLNLELMEQPVITAPDTVVVNQPIYFSAEDTNWNRWDIEGYYWDFGNGVHEKGKNVTYQYTLPGEYTVILGLKENIRNRRFDPEKTSVYKAIVVLGEE